jgi:hypothetical protein
MKRSRSVSGIRQSMLILCIRYVVYSISSSVPMMLSGHSGTFRRKNPPMDEICFGL